MQFSSGVFLMIFLPLTMGIYKIFGGLLGHRFKNIVLLLASFIFYAWGEPLFVFVLMLGIGFNYAIGIIIEKSEKNKRTFLIVSLVFNLGILFVFKYFSFVIRELSRGIPLNQVNIALPIGISFYTFQIMGYIFDIYYGKISAQKDIFSLALYISMFPQLVAGPIVRYSDIEKEIYSRTETIDSFCQGTNRFVVGMAKKVLIADFLGNIADNIFVTAEYSEISLITAWIGAIAYTFEIYYDFSGYSDMAIGLGMCFGFHFKENFDYPYVSCSVTEFWKRWHISLTDWFRDYVYFPLGGNRVSASRHILNLFVVWLLTGIWHGAEWTYIIWGLMYFVIQLFEKKTAIMDRIPKIFDYIATMFIVVIGWIIFRASSLSCAIDYIRAMFGSDGIVDSSSISYLKSSAVIFTISYIGALPIRIWIGKWFKNKIFIAIKEYLWIPMSAALFGLCILVIINDSYNPFIYYIF